MVCRCEARNGCDVLRPGMRWEGRCVCVCVPVWDLGPGAWGRKERGESGNAVVVVVAVVAVVVGGG